MPPCCWLTARHQAKREELANALQAHLLGIRDAGFLPEAERLRRAMGTTIHEYCADPKNYPLGVLLDTADAASTRDSKAFPQLKEAFKNADSGVRYWAAMGVLMRGESATKLCHAELTAALKDEAPSVRIAAAEALAKFGDDVDRSTALAVLEELVSPAENGVYVSMAALNAVDALGPSASPLLRMIADMQEVDPKAPERLRSYVPRLVESIQAQGRGDG